MTRPLLAALILLAAAAPAMAETVTCPDLAAAAKIGSCPTEQELKWGFTGYCSDNARMYDKYGGDVCHSIEHYAKLKDVALWEVGEFQGYLHCSLAADTIKTAKPTGIAVTKVGAISRVACDYEGGLEMTLRTRKACRAEGDRVECE